MEYNFCCDVKASDLWKISMGQTYRSVLGVVNIVFTVAAILMTTKLWTQYGSFAHALMLICCLMFPVFQPLAVYGRSVKQLEEQKKGVNLTFRDANILVTCGNESEMISWSQVTRVRKHKNMIVIMTDGAHGYMLMDRITGLQKDDFYLYLVDRCKNASK